MGDYLAPLHLGEDRSPTHLVGVEAALEIGESSLVVLGAGRVERRELLSDRLRHLRRPARVGEEVRVAGGVEIALAPVDGAGGSFQHGHRGGRAEAARASRLNVRIARLVYPRRQPTDLE